MIAYDHELLERILGGKLDPIPEDDHLGRLTARALTDSAPERTPHNAPATRLSCATFWLKKLRDEALVAGIRKGRAEMARDVRQKLGID